MGWHIQITRATARYFRDSKPAEDNYAERVAPDAIAQVDMRGDGSAYLHATMSREDGSTSPRAWRDLARKLREAFGIKTLTYDHKQRASAHEAERAGDGSDAEAVER